MVREVTGAAFTLASVSPTGRGEISARFEGRHHLQPLGASPAEPPPVREADVKSAVDKLESAARILNHKIHFEIHQATNSVVVHVIDKTTNETIRSIPGEEALELSSRIDDFLGILFDAMS